MPKVAIIYLLWSNEPQKYLSKALAGVSTQTFLKENLHLVIIYNSHQPDEPSAIEYIKTEVEKRKADLPAVTVLEQPTNLGFAKANNLGAKWAIDNNFDYVFLHNGDGSMASEGISELVKAMESDKQIGQAQSLVLLEPERELINSAGNAWHYLGIGFCSKYRRPLAQERFLSVENIGYVSGAATMMRADLLKQHGLLNENFFLYHEDTEYSWRLKIRGYKLAMAANSIFYHQYQFNKNIKKYYWLERNRHVMNYLLYRWPTLILLLPLEILYNLGLAVVSIFSGWFTELLKVYVYWFNYKNWVIWNNLRRQYQRDRKMSDRQIIAGASYKIDSGELVVPVLVKHLANFGFTLYYLLLKILVWW